MPRRACQTPLADLRFLHSLHPDTLLLTDQQEGSDVYSGKVDIEAPNAFLTTWGVVGPSTQGQIVSMFTRESSESGAS